MKIEVVVSLVRLRLAAKLLFCAAAVTSAPAQSVSFTTLVSFDGADGAYPFAALVQASDQSFYGTATSGGGSGIGTAFKLTPGVGLSVLHSFNVTDGSVPYAGLVQAADGSFYGTTEHGGNIGLDYGTVFKITPNGTFTLLHSFDGSDGDYPFGGLVQDRDGNFYGTTSGGEQFGNCYSFYGTVFTITPEGTLTTLHSFNGRDGSAPCAGLVQGTDGNFYGTTSGGGVYNGGTVFQITPSGTLTILYSFSGADGLSPEAGLVRATDGNFYGTTAFEGTGNGTVFKITPEGMLTTLHYFNGSDGSMPYAGLVQAADGNFYGTTSGGGTSGDCDHGCGTAFRMTPEGAVTTLHSFCSQPNCADGNYPYGGLMQAADGFFYGTTSQGGANGFGTVFRVGLVQPCSHCRP